jgi:hypothetical protein
MIDPLTISTALKAGGAVFGGIQAAIGKKKMKEADKMAPGLEDLTSRNVALEDAKRKTKQLASGTDTTTQEAIKSADQSTTATQKQLATVTGGNVPGTVSALLQAQTQGGNIKNKAFAQAGERGLAMSNTANAISKEINQKIIDLKQFKSVQRRGEGANAVQTGMGNMMAGIGSLTPTDGGGAEGATPELAKSLIEVLKKLGEKKTIV